MSELDKQKIKALERENARLKAQLDELKKPKEVKKTKKK